MAILTTTNRVTYNGGVDIFSYPYLFYEDAELIVIHTTADGVSQTLTRGHNYAVTGAGEPTGGTVTVTPGLIPVTDTLAIERIVPPTQESEFEDAAYERALDKLTMIVQQILDDRDRLIQIPVADATTITTELPIATLRAGKYCGFDSAGNVTALDMATDTTITGYGDGLTLTDTILELADSITKSKQYKGDALHIRFKDTGTSGQEWCIRSDGGNFEICMNTGTELAPTWTVYRRITTTGLQDASGNAIEYKLKVSSDDTTGGHLSDKVTAGSGIIFTVTDPAGNEAMSISTDGKVLVDSADTTRNYLENKILAGDGITITQSSGNKTMTVAQAYLREAFPFTIPLIRLSSTATGLQVAGTTRIMIPFYWRYLYFSVRVKKISGAGLESRKAQFRVAIGGNYSTAQTTTSSDDYETKTFKVNLSGCTRGQYNTMTIYITGTGGSTYCCGSLHKSIIDGDTENEGRYIMNMGYLSMT
jgi:hypothetical protein